MLMFNIVLFKNAAETHIDLQAECRMKHFWQFLITVISWKYVRRRPICFVTAPRVSVFHSPAIFAVLHWSSVFKHRTLLCFCLSLVTISIGRKSKHRSFWWRSLHEVNMSRRCVLNDQWRRYTNYSCKRIPVDGPPTRVCVSGSLLALLTYEYPGEYGLIPPKKQSSNALWDTECVHHLSPVLRSLTRTCVRNQRGEAPALLCHSCTLEIRPNPSGNLINKNLVL